MISSGGIGGSGVTIQPPLPSRVTSSATAVRLQAAPWGRLCSELIGSPSACLGKGLAPGYLLPRRPLWKCHALAWWWRGKRVLLHQQQQRRRSSLPSGGFLFAEGMSRKAGRGIHCAEQEAKSFLEAHSGGGGEGKVCDSGAEPTALQGGLPLCVPLDHMKLGTSCLLPASSQRLCFGKEY